MSTRVLRSMKALRSAKGKVRAVREKGLIMGPLSNWGKKSIVISGGTQYTLEDLMEVGWEKMGKMREVKSALNQVADAGKKLFEKDMNSLYIK